jgi:VCBS repeat-containing protein
VTPTAAVTNVTDTETASIRSASFNIGAQVSVANAGTPTGYVSDSAALVSASVPSGLPSSLTDPAFLRTLLTIDPDGTVRYDSSKFGFLADGQSLSYTIAFDVKSGTDTLHLTLTFTVTGVNEAPTITVGPGDTATATVIDNTQATTLHAQGTLSFRDADATDGHSLSVAVKSGHAIGSFVAGIIADTTGADSTNPSVAGDIGWVFVADKAHLQSLAAGETETEVFTITLNDGHGGTTSEDVTVTVVGVNDAPTVTAGSTTPTGGFPELAGKTNDTSDKDQASGTIAFADPDLTDSHTVTQASPTFTWSAGTLTAAQKAALTQASPLTLVQADSTGTGFGSVSWTYSAADKTFDFLAAGEKLTITYNVTIDDGHGGTVTRPVTVTVTGTNDAPVINGGPITASVQEDGTTLAKGQLSATDPDLTDTQTWSIVGASATHAPDYQFKIDEFKIVKNASTFFDDTFSDNNPPPSAPTGTGSGNVSSYSVTGTVSEQGDKAILTGSNAGFGTGSSSGDPFFGEYATLNTNIDSSDSTHGLKDNSSFTVSGLFDLTLPAEDRNEYGIRLTDRTSSQAGDSTVELKVSRGADGIERVQLREIDFSTHTNTVLQSFSLNPGSHDQILLSLAYDPSNPHLVQASFELEQGGVLDSSTLKTFNTTGTLIFSGENWTRAQFFAEAPEQSDSVLQGTYGQLDITQAGAWTYQLANGQANVQALAAGQTVQDTFTARVADGHGSFDTKTITVNVTGTNDNAIISVGAGDHNTGAVTENAHASGTETSSGTLSFSDVDLTDHHSVTGVTASSGALGTLTASVTHDTTGAGTGGVLTWNYSVADSAINYLAAGQTKLETFTVSLFDGSSTVTKNVTVTITGTDDAPTIAAGTTATGNIVAAPQNDATSLTALAESYLTAGHDLINGLGGSSGFGENDLARGDDNSSGAIDITSVFGAAGLNFFGHGYTSLYINNNGNITFGSPTSQFTPSVITGGTNNPIIAPFWADVDTRGGSATATPGGNSTGANLVHYDLDTTNGVMTVTWDDVGYYSQHESLLDAFQVQLINVGNGDFDVVFRYEDINWTTGDASGGSGGLGGQPARAGYSAGDGVHYFELSQSGNQAQMLALESTTGNTGIAGVDVFEVRNGDVVSNSTTSGTILFSDADLSDTHSVGVSLSSAVRSAGGDIPRATQADLANALITSMTGPTGHDSTGSGSGQIGWVFNLPHADTNFLAVGETMTVTYNVTVDDNHGGTVTQPVTVTITNTTPTISVAISGTAQEGQTLTANATTNDAEATIHYQWQNSSDGTTWSDISGATNSTYTLAESDENKFVRVHTSTTDNDSGQTASANSAATASKVVDVAPTLSVSISGNAIEGSTLTATATQSSDETMSVAYQWQNSSNSTTWTNISGATGSTYTLAESDENKFVRVHTSATDDTGQTVTADSNATATKVVDAFTLSVSMSGNAIEGSTLTATATQSGAETMTIQYQWQNSSDSTIWTNITGATNSTYTLAESDENKFVRVHTSATDDDTGQTVATADSSATANKVVDVAPTLSVSISGNAVEGSTLTATATQSSDETMSVAYQWQNSSDGTTWSNISGATNSTYTLSESDENNFVRVHTSATDDTGQTVTADSSSTASKVVDVAPTLSVLISGNAIEGSTLTATATQSSDETMSVAYQWQNSSDGTTWSEITNATNSTYTLAGTDGNTFVRVHTSASDDTGQTVTADSARTYVTTGEEDDWNTTDGGNWESAGNWTPHVPSSNSAAVIALSGSYIVSITSSTAHAGTLTINNADAVLAADSGYALTVNGALTLNAGVISLTGGTIQAGSIDLETGTTLRANTDHTSSIAGDMTGTGTIEILNHASLEIDGSAASNMVLSLTGGEGATGTLILDHALTKPFNAVISGLNDQDVIDLKDLTYVSGHMTATTSYASGLTTLVVSNGSDHVNFTLSGNYTSSTWIFAKEEGSGTGTVFHDPPGAPLNATTVSTTTDVASTVSASLTTRDGTADQFTFQNQSQSGTPASGPTLVASADPSATDAATPDSTSSTPSDHQPTDSATTVADTPAASNVAVTSQQPTGDTTNTSPQTGATTQTAVAPAAIGSNGSDMFVFAANFGHETITNFHPDTDVIAFDHTVFADFQAVLAAAHDDGQGNAVIAANSHDSITIKNVTVTQLAQHQGDFHFT